MFFQPKSWFEIIQWTSFLITMDSYDNAGGGFVVVPWTFSMFDGRCFTELNKRLSYGNSTDGLEQTLTDGLF